MSQPAPYPMAVDVCIPQLAVCRACNAIGGHVFEIHPKGIKKDMRLGEFIEPLDMVCMDCVIKGLDPHLGRWKLEGETLEDLLASYDHICGEDD